MLQTIIMCKCHSHLLQLSLRLLLHPADVLHGELHPAVNPTEELTVEVGEDSLLLLQTQMKNSLLL